MGFTPLEGVPMATRSGSVDPGALLYLLRERGLDADELDDALEHESGLAAPRRARRLRERRPLALAVFTYRVAGAVAAMAVALGGLDALVFTGGRRRELAPTCARAVCGAARASSATSRSRSSRPARTS